MRELVERAECFVNNKCATYKSCDNCTRFIRQARLSMSTSMENVVKAETAMRENKWLEITVCVESAIHYSKDAIEKVEEAKKCSH